ncbi:mannose-ethanolamine phosphotransferase gpi13 [Elasticomyces elasticus]|nr:mannose-ethanolamine phosphotransferase gpi13 [Elasticomyces elasticus]
MDDGELQAESGNGSSASDRELNPEVASKQREVQFKAAHGLLVAFFTFVLLLHIGGISLFLSGFLLTRRVLDEKSKCSESPLYVEPTAIGENAAGRGTYEDGCWHEKSFDKAVIIVIDALRYDFAAPYPPSSASVSLRRPRHYHNSIPVLYETAAQQSGNALLLPFIADPPTTTLQRLKGLTTGTLPTFVEGGSNFAGAEILEDNLIGQLQTAGKKVVHLGDDTWTSLFPGHFHPNLSHAYDSFNVWDLHTVDNGVTEHLFPLLQFQETVSGTEADWDVIIAHYLGVDHAGHRYGPDHLAMSDKLAQMDEVVRQAISSLPNDTLLVVMGDHGMDPKGDHGGESDLEVESTLFLYSAQAHFGTPDTTLIAPPATARERDSTGRERSVPQIDIVPTLSLLLGLPIPYSNLGKPIPQAFLGRKTGKPDWKNLAEVDRITAAQVHRYHVAYSNAPSSVTKLSESVQEDHKTDDEVVPPTGDALDTLWLKALQRWKAAEKHPNQDKWREVAETIDDYLSENLAVNQRQWASFNLPLMYSGIFVLVGSVLVSALYARGAHGNASGIAPPLLLRGLLGSLSGSALSFLISGLSPLSFLFTCVFLAVSGGIVGITSGLASLSSKIPLPASFWGWICFLSVLLPCISFASNSFTIWEDEILLFLLVTSGVLLLASSLRQRDPQDRAIGTINSIIFLVLTRTASLSRLCREEQMPYCRSTYYASATSSTSSSWQLAIPWLATVLLPSVIRDFYARTKNYNGSAIVWIGFAFRTDLFLIAKYWLLDAADDGDWLTGKSLYGTINVGKDTLKTMRITIAQVVLSVAFAAGYATFLYASPFISVRTEDPAPELTKSIGFDGQTSTATTTTDIDVNTAFTTITPKPKPAAKPKQKLIILGYANTLGTHYFLLPTLWFLALVLLQKPMGQGTLSLLLTQILCLLEILDANSPSPEPTTHGDEELPPMTDLRNSAVGPTLLALLALFHFFKTGHQATLSSIQWEAAFVPLRTIRYPWSPLLVILNTFAPQILCAIAVPALALWKRHPRLSQMGLLSDIARDMATHMLVYAAVAVATVIEAAWLRRHLMLYRVFMPRMLMGVVMLGVVEVVGIAVALMGVRTSIGSVKGVFGW